MAVKRGPRKATPHRPQGMVSTFPDFYATTRIKQTLDIPGHGQVKIDVQPGDRLPGELQNYPVINLFKLAGSTEDANARTGERNVRWKPRARPQGRHPSAAIPETELLRGIIIPEAVSKALDAAGFNTPEAALAATDAELLVIKGIGKKTLVDIRALAQSMIDAPAEQDTTTDENTDQADANVGPGDEQDDEPGDGDSEETSKKTEPEGF